LQFALRRSCAVLTATLIAACSGISGPGTQVPSTGGFGKPQSVAARIVVKFPARGHRPKHRGPQYVSEATQSIVFTLTDVDGVAPPAGFTTSMTLTFASPHCTGSGPYICSTNWTVPAASDSFSVAAYDAAAGAGKLLSKNTITQTIAVGASTIGVTLDGVPATISLAPMPTTGIIGGTLTATQFAVGAQDPDGYTIVGAYSTPIVLSSSDSTGAITLATSGGDSPPASELLSSTDVATIAYNGNVIDPATITAAATGATSASAIFLADQRLSSFSAFDAQASGLIDVGGELYGTAEQGGTNSDGVVFEVSLSGVQSILYSFKGGADGAVPSGGLFAIGNELYGTTENGGTNNEGTVFEISTGGTESVLHSFGTGNDGQYPYGALLAIGSELYGTTFAGGSLGKGTVFQISTAGAESVMHNFGMASDGESPEATLVDVGGVLYGTTYQGSALNDGTVFAITTAGGYTVLHAFAGGTDGQYPYKGVVAIGNELYGVTFSGGTANDGTVFAISTAGTESVLHSFIGGADGKSPDSELLAVGNELYGVTPSGGTTGFGVLYEISTSGVESVLHTFGIVPDVKNPDAQLLAIGSELYGTANSGGGSNLGGVFEIAEP
jgi:uncharacterized repeat protein (TIGR03803 family)